MITIFFEAHATTLDNEAHIASGHNDAALSSLGIQQAKEMGTRYENDHFDTVFCSDLQRSYDTAKIAFQNRFTIVKDKRLRECDYGDFTGRPSAEVDEEKAKRVHYAFPRGESYDQAMARMKGFLAELLKNYDGKRVMIIGHRATQYALDVLIDGIALEEVVSIQFKWQPGWKYELSELKS